MATVSFQSKVKVNKREAKRLVSILNTSNCKKPEYANIKNKNKCVDKLMFIDKLRASFK